MATRSLHTPKVASATLRERQSKIQNVFRGQKVDIWALQPVSPVVTICKVNPGYQIGLIQATIASGNHC